MKNSFFVFLEIVFAVLFICFASISTFIWFAVDAFGDDVVLSIVLTFMLVVVPIILFAWCFCVCAAKIFVDETGITKCLLGIKLKHYMWDEIDHIKCYGNSSYITSLSFYKKRRENKYERIFFACSSKKLDIINKYAPDYIKQKIS